MKEKVGIIEKLGFGSYSAASNIVYQFKSLYYLFFLTEVLKISMSTAGTILSLGIVWDAINDPLVGFFAVNRRFKNGERVRPFALWSAVPLAVTVVLLFTNFHASDTLTVVIASVVYFLFELLYTASDIPYNCMAGLATNSDSARRSINVHRNIGSCVGTAVGAVACFPLLKLFGALDAGGNLREDTGSRGFLFTAFIMAAICIFGCLVHYFTTRERVVAINEKEEHVGIFHIFKVLYTYKPFVLNTVYILLYGVSNLLLLTCITYYCTYVLGSSDDVTMIEAAYLVASLATTVLVPFIDSKLGRKKTMLLGGAFFVIGKIWFIIDPYSLPALYVNCIMTGIAVAITYVMFNTNRNNLSDLVEWREGRRYDGMIGTADNLSSKLGQAIVAKLITGALSISGYDANLDVQPAATVSAINAMIGWVPAIFGAGIILVVIFLNMDKEMAKMNAEKNAKQ